MVFFCGSADFGVYFPWFLKGFGLLASFGGLWCPVGSFLAMCFRLLGAIWRLKDLPRPFWAALEAFRGPPGAISEAKKPSNIIETPRLFVHF